MKVRHYNYQSLLFVLVTLMVLCLQGCRSKKSVADAEGEKIGSPREWLSALQEKQLQYETFGAKLNVEISDNHKDIGSRVDLRMVKGKTLQLSVQPLLGIEVFRIQFTPDSILMLDRLNKVYAIEDYSALKEKFPLEFNFNNLQALFTNQFFLPGEAELDKSHYNRFRLENQTDYVNVKTKERAGIHYNFKVEHNRQLTMTKISEPSAHYALEWNYMDFRPFYEILFPMNMNIRILENERDIAHMKIRFSKIQHNSPINTEFAIPSRYKRVDLMKVIESLLKKEMN